MSRLGRRGQLGADGHDHGGSDEGLDHDQLPLVASMQLSPVEGLVLDTARCFCHGWTGGEVGAWNHAFHIAEVKLGPLEGPSLVARVFGLMRSLLRERRGGIRYMPFGCSRICKSEEILMSAVQSARRGDDETVRRAVSWFFGSAWPEETETFLALRTLGALCDHYQSGQTAATKSELRTNRVLH